MTFEIVTFVVKLLFLFFGIIMPLASLCTWIERKGSALIQDRIGANRAGAFFEFNFGMVKRWPPVLRTAGAIVVSLLIAGSLAIGYQFFNLALSPILLVATAVLILISFAIAPLLTYCIALPVVAGIKIAGQLGIINTLLNDAVKALFKEDFVPEGVSNFMHCLAPFLAVLPVFLAFAIIPVAPDFEVLGHTVRMQVAPLGVGILFFLAMGSVAVYGVALAGWTGNNKYSLLGGLRAAAQMISYELAMGITIVTMIVIFGTPDLYAIIQAQKGAITHWGVFSSWGVGAVASVVLFIVGMAETKRAPFDLPESESELVAGYFTEYSGMKFLIFWLGEFAEIALFSLVIVALFFGGWHTGLPTSILELPENVWWAALIGHAVLMAKVTFFCVLQIVIRWTLPRLRYDQLMNLGWKMLLPISMVNLVVAAALKLVG